MGVIAKTETQALSLLKVLGVEFYVKLSDGSEHQHGDFVVQRETPRQRRHRITPPKYPHGTVANYVAQFLKDLQVGEVAVIPYAPYDRQSVKQGACSKAGLLWGPRTYNTCENGDQTAVEILRMA